MLLNLVTQILTFLFLAAFIGVLAWTRSGKQPTNAPRDPFPAAKRVWKVTFVALWAVGMAAMLAFTYLWYDYQDHKPRVPQAHIGRTHAKYMRGVTVYLTTAEEQRIDAVEDVSFGCVICGFVLGGIMQSEQWRIDKRRYERPT